MALLIIILFIILMIKLGNKGRAHRVETHLKNRKKQQILDSLNKQVALIPSDEEIRKQVRHEQEEKFRKELENEGYTPDLIATILPTIMANEK